MSKVLPFTVKEALVEFEGNLDEEWARRAIATAEELERADQLIGVRSRDADATRELLAKAYLSYDEVRAEAAELRLSYDEVRAEAAELREALQTLMVWHGYTAGVRTNHDRDKAAKIGHAIGAKDE